MWLIDIIKSIFGKGSSGIENHGLVESPLDYRDIPLGAVQKLVPMPDEYMIPYNLPITHQGGKPHCVGHAGALIKGEKERREQNFMDFDPAWLYKECKKIDGIPNARGTYFRAVLKVLKNKGAMPVGETDLKIAEKYRIGGYARIEPLTFKNLKSAVFQNGVGLAGFKGSNEGWSRGLKGYIRRPVSGERVWGHATGLIGYKDNIVGQNSWGKRWGDKGRFYFNDRYMPFEAWAVLVDLPNDWKKLIGIGRKPKYTFNKNLYFGIEDPDVRVIQECMKYEGCLAMETRTVDYFGFLTLEAVKSFQRKYGIRPVAGYVGRLTRAKLNELFV